MSTTPTIVSAEATPVPVNPIPSTSTSTDQATPAPQSEWDLILAQLHETPRNPDGWNRLITLAEESGDLKKIEDSYEGLLQTYPNTAAAQIAYINHFLNPGLFKFAEALFNRFLRTSVSVDLWKFYLIYVRRVNSGPNTRDIIRKAYEFALNHVGQDKDSSEIWSDFIQFLKSGEESTTWEQQQKMDALRKVYHRVVQIPVEGIDKFWQELEAFENGLNRITAKKFMGDLSPAHMQARTVLRQLETHLRTLFPPMPASQNGRPAMYLPRMPTFNPGERALVGAWKAYLKWEESNPLEIEEKDKTTFLTRMQGIYRQSVIRMRYFAEIWYMAFVWTSSVGKNNEALAILKAGLEANPSSFLLTFAYAEVQELNGNFAEVHSTYEKFLDILRHELEAVESRVSSTNSSFSSNIPTTTNQPSASQQEQTQESNNSQSTSASFSTQTSDDKPPKSKELAERKSELALAMIMFLRFCRRAEGLKASRTLFTKMRKDRWTTWEVYEAAALTEYHCTKKMDVAGRILEKGLELFGDEVEFVLRYLAFLISVNDENNARALFERVVGNFPPDKARPLWERWARYVYQFGDLEAAQKLEKRIAEVYATDPPIKRFAQRHTYLGTDAIAARDLGFALARQGTGSTGSVSGGTNNALGKTDTQFSLLNSTPNQSFSASNKRPPSPDHKKREDRAGTGDYGPPGHKRQRALSPAVRERDRDRDRDRWEGPPPSRRRYGSPSPWERDRERDGGGPSRRERPPPEKEDEQAVSTLPPIMTWFVGMLPSPSAFDGPVFRTDDLMQVFRNAVIPSTSSLRSRSPPPSIPPRSGRPPPDYGPYQGPGGIRRR